MYTGRLRQLAVAVAVCAVAKHDSWFIEARRHVHVPAARPGAKFMYCQLAAYIGSGPPGYFPPLAREACN
jgi:hypothetical protein